MIRTSPGVFIMAEHLVVSEFLCTDKAGKILKPHQYLALCGFELHYL